MCHILVVDDDARIQDLFETALIPRLRRPAWTFAFATSGEAAQRLIAQAAPPFEVVLTDIIMPGMDGLELLDWIAKHHPLIRVIMVSAFSDWENVQIAMSREAFGFVQKPIDFDMFQKTLTKAVQYVRKHKQAAAAMQAGLAQISQALKIIETADRLIASMHRVEPGSAPIPQEPEDA